jgi:hypothetical protein
LIFHKHVEAIGAKNAPHITRETLQKSPFLGKRTVFYQETVENLSQSSSETVQILSMPKPQLQSPMA